eukprot:4368275-Pyramimonas_sp.AAC.3
MGSRKEIYVSATRRSHRVPAPVDGMDTPIFIVATRTLGGYAPSPGSPLARDRTGLARTWFEAW